MKGKEMTTTKEAPSEEAAPSLQLAAPQTIEGLMEGRIVHFVSPDRTCRPAIVVRVGWARGHDVVIGTDDQGVPVKRSTWMLPDAGYCSLTVFTDTGVDTGLFPEGHGGGSLSRSAVPFHPAAEYREDNESGTWHWPERG